MPDIQTACSVGNYYSEIISTARFRIIRSYPQSYTTHAYLQACRECRFCLISYIVRGTLTPEINMYQAIVWHMIPAIQLCNSCILDKDMNVHYNKHVRVLLFNHKKPYSTCSELRIGRVRMSVKEYDSESHNRYPFSWICDHQTCHSRFSKLSKLHTTCSDLCTANIHTSVTKI